MIPYWPFFIGGRLHGMEIPPKILGKPTHQILVKPSPEGPVLEAYTRWAWFDAGEEQIGCYVRAGLWGCQVSDAIRSALGFD